MKEQQKKDLPEFIKINRNFSSSVGFNRVKATDSKRPSKVLGEMADTILRTKDQKREDEITMEPRPDSAAWWRRFISDRAKTFRKIFRRAFASVDPNDWRKLFLNRARFYRRTGNWWMHRQTQTDLAALRIMRKEPE